MKFSIRQVTVKEVRKIMKNMSKKKSKGNDGISQECLLLGLDVLAAPLTKIINTPSPPEFSQTNGRKL